MAINKKHKRKITVGENVFYWFYKFERDVLRLIVMTDEKTRSRLVCEFKYKNLWLYFKELVAGEPFYENKMMIISAGVLTPWVVRQVIDIALQKGWRPFVKEKDFILTDIIDTIDINFWTESIAAERQSKIQNLKSKIA